MLAADRRSLVHTLLSLAVLAAALALAAFFLVALASPPARAAADTPDGAAASQSVKR